jgi:pimeloyl-ACP methyl ester carboxylesterase
MERVEVRDGARPLRLAVEDAGEGQPVVFVHGLAGFRELWDESAAAVRAAGFRAVAYDHRGHGESDDPPAPWSIGDLADDLAGLLDALGIERPWIVGHSMGGRTLFRFAIDRPNRLAGVVIVGAQSEAPRPPYDESIRSLLDGLRARGVDGFTEAFGAIGELPERVARDAAYRERFERLYARNRAAPLEAAVEAILRMMPLTERLGEIAVPALVVVGDRDLPFMRMVETYRSRIPDCAVAILPNCHHYPMVDRPAEFARALVGFLEAHRDPH